MGSIGPGFTMSAGAGGGGRGLKIDRKLVFMMYNKMGGNIKEKMIHIKGPANLGSSLPIKVPY